MSVQYSEQIQLWQQKLPACANQLIEQAKQRGATSVEVSLGGSSGLSVNARLGEVETVEFNQDQSLSLTLYKGQRKGHVSITDLTESALSNAVDVALAFAQHTAEDPFSGLAEAELMAKNWQDPELYFPANVSVDQLVEQALACETAGRADPLITNSDGASAYSGERVFLYANSHGFSGMIASTNYSASCVLIAGQGDGMQRDYWYDSGRQWLALADPQSIGQKAAERTIARLNPKKLSTTKAPVLFSPEVSSGLIGHLMGAISGGSLYRNASFLKDRLGEKLFPDFVSVYEQPNIKGGMGSSPFDQEGVATRDNIFVQNGILASYMLGSYSARKLGLSTTANSGGARNLRVTSTGEDADQMLAKLGTGLLVTELMGQGLNMVTGDYSRGAAGFWVENGVIQYPVHEITIAGNLNQMYQQIVAIGTDIDTRGNTHVGSVLIGEMMIAGA
ncbi:microcin-processing peptidase 1. Unknown type peptidase. MEROPS family U62 [Oceanospirillum multiglobuliferum]|uniref:Metalloprotease PmbA n=1 Tax=Oceanospirillum multiglobuliferum TaxID=64969 RepID=A0A1T4KUQ6_9GAMM|nr:metalloprotease PmbA [Oceanospirillum multiglobuliferum]OPX54952.1 metalloprotease PmbA [Oceanospirillum multiglobuliferum]SJZ46100.1 microcin-processing peptidase 1. Unknown type peptidase. MEROPS family U62 [Oceanospirillum multiglobuliferum]